jgi:hypothetical protein
MRPRRSRRSPAGCAKELDLDTLTAELLVVVNQTIEPTKTSLWLRPSAEGSRRIIG